MDRPITDSGAHRACACFLFVLGAFGEGCGGRRFGLPLVGVASAMKVRPALKAFWEMILEA